MEKMIGEEDLKGLEEEIDDAVDRLFVEKKRGAKESVFLEPPTLETPSKPKKGDLFLNPPRVEPSPEPFVLEPSVKSTRGEPLLESPSFEPSPEPFILEPSITSPVSESSVNPSILDPSVNPSILESSLESPIDSTPDLTLESSLLEPSYELEKIFDMGSSPPPPPAPVPFLKSIETMEAHLLSLEWEISEGKLKKTREEVIALRELLKQKADISSILRNMEKALNHMIQDEENIEPPWIKFLLDAKDTIKLLMRKEAEGEINTYKQLAYQGIEARFSNLEKMKEVPLAPPSFGKETIVEQTEAILSGEKKIQDLSNRMNLFMEKAEQIFRTVGQQIARLEEAAQRPPAPLKEESVPPMGVTIFKINEKLFGVESERVFKLFKVPDSFPQKYANHHKIRLRDLEVKLVNLKKILALQGEDPQGEFKFLTVKDNGEYKGFLVDQVCKKLSAPPEKGGGMGEYFIGIVHSTYQERPVEIPILDLKKF
jgi:chemotaxis signal transduction protein